MTASAETSFYWCKLSAQQGYAPALNDVGIKVEVYGEGVDAFRSAAAQHYPAAYFNLALCSHFVSFPTYYQPRQPNHTKHLGIRPPPSASSCDTLTRTVPPPRNVLE